MEPRARQANTVPPQRDGGVIRTPGIDGAVPPPALYTPGGFRPEQSVGYLMKRVLTSIVQQAELRLKPHALTHAQWHPLFALKEEGKPMSVVRLARELQMDTGATTRLVDRLERKRLVRRVRSQDDRRLVMVELTPAGVSAATCVPGVLCDVMNAHLAGFTQAEWERLVESLQRMLANGEATLATRP
jgi:DNA-binding MarR family transcriptional regulator